MSPLLGLFSVLGLVGSPAQVPEGVQLPIRVSVAVYAVAIDAIHEGDGNFEATFDVIQRWRDPAAGFDRASEGTDRVELTGAPADEKLATLWTPQTTLRNLVGEPDSRSAGLRIFSDGRVEYVQRLHGKFAFPIDLARFPFDSQSLALEVASSVYTARQVTLVHGEEDNDRSGIDSRAELPEWSFDDQRFRSGVFRGWNGAAYSEMIATVSAKRDTQAYVPSLFAPLCVILLLPLLCLWVRTEVHERVNWVVTALFALVALNFSVSLEYPALGVESAFMRLFWYGYAGQGAILLIILFFYNEGPLLDRLGPDLTDEITDYLAWAVPLISVVSVANVILSVAV